MRNDSVMIDRFIRYIQTERRYSNLTVLAYSRDLEEFVKYLINIYGVADITQATTAMVRSFMVELKKNGQENRSSSAMVLSS